MSVIARLSRSSVWVSRAQYAFNSLGPHARVARNARLAGKALLLTAPRSNDPFANLRGTLAGPFARNFPELHRRHFDVQINAVQQRSGDASEVILDFARRTAALMRHFAVRRRVHGRHEHELR